jgi:hypothetical protein
MVTDITPALAALRAAHAQHMLMLAAHPRGNVEVEARAAGADDRDAGGDAVAR